MRKKAEDVKLTKNLKRHEKDFLEVLKMEWDALQREARKEELVRKGKHAAEVTMKTLLGILAVGGILTVAAVAPGVSVVYDKFFRRKTFVNKEGVMQKLYYLKRHKYIQWEKIAGKKHKIMLTQEGKAKAYILLFNELGKGRKKIWDKTWKIIAFDIPEKHRKERDAFREKLVDLGFFALQESVFVCPYACSEELRLIMSALEVEKYVKIVEAKNISGETELRKVFEIRN